MQATSDGTYLQIFVRGALDQNRPVLLVSDDREDDRPSEVGLPTLNQRLQPFVKVPWGMVRRLCLPGGEPSDSALLSENAALWQQLNTRGVYANQENSDPLQLSLLVRYFNAHKALGMLAENQGQKELARAHYTGASLIFRDPEIEAGLKRLRF